MTIGSTPRLRTLCGYGTSVIACDAEVGVEQHLTGVAGVGVSRPQPSSEPTSLRLGVAGVESSSPQPSGEPTPPRLGAADAPTPATPDGRPGAAVMLFGFSTDQLAKAAPNRVGQCLLTCPTTAVFNGLPNSEDQVPLGKKLRFFGDGFQKSKLLDGRRYWRIPVMDGEFLVEEQLGVEKGIAGGNLIIQGVDQPTSLAAARRAVEAIAELPGVIAPFPGGVGRAAAARSVDRYKGMIASTNEAFCPTLRGRITTGGRVTSELVPAANCAYEIVINGVDEASISRRHAHRAARRRRPRHPRPQRRQLRRQTRQVPFQTPRGDERLNRRWTQMNAEKKEWTRSQDLQDRRDCS